MEQIIGELVNGAKAVILSIYEDNTGIKEKLNDLDSLVLKIRGTVELTNTIEIRRNRSLRALRRKFMRAATHGEDVLQEFENRTNQTGLGDQEGSSSSSYAQTITRRIKRWTWAYKDVKRINETIRMLEKTYVDAKDFHELLKREMSIRADRLRILLTSPAAASYNSLATNYCAQLTKPGRHLQQIESSNGEQRQHRKRKIEGVYYGSNSVKIVMMEILVTRLSVLIEEGKRESNDSPWLIPRLAKMTEAVTQGKTALKMIKNIPWFIHKCDNLAERLKRMNKDLGELRELRVLKM